MVCLKVNYDLNEPDPRTIPFVQKQVMRELTDITDKEEIEHEIQDVTELQFDLAHRAPIPFQLSRISWANC